MLNEILSAPGETLRRYRGRLALAFLLTLMFQAAPGGAADDTWLCEATVGTAYEYDASAGHWQTRLFPVDQRWRFERLRISGGSAAWRAVALSQAGATLDCQSSSDSRGRPLLFCGESGQLRLDFGHRLLSIALPPQPEGQQRARTAVGRCRAAGD